MSSDKLVVLMGTLCLVVGFTWAAFVTAQVLAVQRYTSSFGGISSNELIPQFALILFGIVLFIVGLRRVGRRAD